MTKGSPTLDLVFTIRDKFIENVKIMGILVQVAIHS